MTIVTNNRENIGKNRFDDLYTLSFNTQIITNTRINIIHNRGRLTRDNISAGINWCSESNTEEETLIEGITTSMGCVIQVEIVLIVVDTQVVVPPEERK